jgi:glutamine amidotransferase
MCELMGMSFARPLSAAFSIKTFALRSDENPDGWGLAWYPDRAAAIVKEPVKWGESHFARFLETYPSLRSSLYIAHVRHKTVGDFPSYADTHPFSRERGGREYCFAHNGTLQGTIWTLPTGRYTPLGQTDSERGFCHLMHTFDERGGTLDDEESWRWLHGELSRLNTLGKFNCLFSDGIHLFCYHDLGAWKGLTFRWLLLDDENRHLKDATVDVALEGAAPNAGYVIATCPLDSSSWHKFHVGELIVFSGGIARYSSHRDVNRVDFRGDEDE